MWVTGDEQVDKATNECWSYSVSGSAGTAVTLWNNFRDWASCDDTNWGGGWADLLEASFPLDGSRIVPVAGYLSLYSLPGLYSVLQESNARAETIHTVNELGDRVSSGLGLFSHNARDTIYSLGLNIPEYEAWRHDFS